MKTKRDRNIAIAGIFQAASLVQELAWTGKFNNSAAITSINSIFTIDANSIADIYPNLTNLQQGLASYIRIFEGNDKHAKDQEIARYVLSLIYLERCLIKKPDLLVIIKNGILRVQAQLQHFPLTHDNIMANLAGIYTDTISTFNFRIHITGEQIYLTNPNNANKIRALLLAGIRAAVLWRQMGGNRWQLLLFRKQLMAEAKALLTEIQQSC